MSYKTIASGMYQPPLQVSLARIFGGGFIVGCALLVNGMTLDVQRKNARDIYRLRTQYEDAAGAINDHDYEQYKIQREAAKHALHIERLEVSLIGLESRVRELEGE